MARRIVYLIDDDPAVLHSTGFLLQSLGVAFEAFADPRQFLAAAEKLQPGFVITDLRMPEIDGFELRSALLDRSVSWPVVLMSSEGRITAEHAEARGFAGFLYKPFSTDDLLAVLDACSRAVEPQMPGAARD